MSIHRVRNFVIIALLIIPLMGGCAIPLKDTQGKLKDHFPAYSRNAVVSVPTTVGNVAGGIIGVGLGAAVAIPAILLGHPKTIGEVFAWSTLIGGGIVGTPFIPLSVLLPEDRWKEESDESGTHEKDNLEQRVLPYHSGKM